MVHGSAAATASCGSLFQMHNLRPQESRGRAQDFVVNQSRRWFWCMLLRNFDLMHTTSWSPLLFIPLSHNLTFSLKAFLMHNKHFVIWYIRKVFSIEVSEKQAQNTENWDGWRAWREKLWVGSIDVFWKISGRLRSWDFRVEKRKQETKWRKDWIYTF